MDKCIRTDKKVASISDVLALLVGKIIAAFRDDGFGFSAKFVDLRGDECWFESRTGIRFMVHRNRITEIREVVPRHMRS
ncbi:MAG: hypothetical protein ABR985_12080 [Methanotrichaceae archaeon]|jgi:hypothetical protein